MGDNGDGTYAVTFTLVEATHHHLPAPSPRLRKARAAIRRAAGRGAARGVELLHAWCGGCTSSEPGSAPRPGTSTANPIRQMSGREAVTVTVHTPSGLAFNNPVKLSSRTGGSRRPCPGRGGRAQRGGDPEGQPLSGAARPLRPRQGPGLEDDRIGGGAGASAAEFTRAGADARVSRWSSSNPRSASSQTTTTTTTTITTRSRQKGADDRDHGGPRNGWRETFVNEEAVEETRMVKVPRARGCRREDGGGRARRRFEFGGGGLKPSAAAWSAARSLSGMAPKVASQALVDGVPPPRAPFSRAWTRKQPAASSTPWNPRRRRRNLLHGGARGGIEALANCPKETRVAVLEAMTPEALARISAR